MQLVSSAPTLDPPKTQICTGERGRRSPPGTACILSYVSSTCQSFAHTDVSRLIQTLSTTKALQHACCAVQAAHHLYQEAKENVDLLCGPNRSKLAVIFSDEESRNRTYLGKS